MGCHDVDGPSSKERGINYSVPSVRYTIYFNPVCNKYISGYKLQADLINSTNHRVLQSVGGVVSCEMQTPKLLWIKKNMPAVWEQAKHFFDLSDFLTWKATGGKSANRSLCSLVCKW